MKSTRKRLIDEATRAFADRGIYGASLIDITRRAGQANRAALYYHFESREGVLKAVLEDQVDFLSRREAELLDIARTKKESDVASVVEAIVRPATELAESGWRGCAYLVITAELVEVDPSALPPEIADVLSRTGGPAVFDVLTTRLPPLEEAIRTERFSLTTGFILRAVADRARARGRRSRKARPQLEQEDFVRNLTEMATAALTAPDKQA